MFLCNQNGFFTRRAKKKDKPFQFNLLDYANSVDSI